MKLSYQCVQGVTYLHHEELVHSDYNNLRVFKSVKLLHNYNIKTVNTNISI